MLPIKGLYEVGIRVKDLARADSGDNEKVVLAAARLGATRLIDNLEF